MTSKKKFDIEASALFGDMTQEDVTKAVKKSAGRPKNESLVREKSAQEGLPVEFTRSTFIVSVEDLNTLKDYAYTERLSIKDVIGQALEEYIEKHVDRSKLLKRPDNWR